MVTGQAAPGSVPGYAIKWLAVPAVLLPFFLAGGWLNPWNDDQFGFTNLGRGTALAHADAAARSDYDAYKLAKLEMPIETAEPPDPPPAESRVTSDRAERIRSAVAAIQAECRHAAAGDWERWQQDTEAYRAQLASRVAASTDGSGSTPWKNNPVNEVLESLDGFPLFEIHSKKYLNHLYDSETLDLFRCERPVVAVDRWLRRRGIDLIFVPIPKMTEVYIEHFVDPCPADGIIAPRVRQAQLELLSADVEVVDGWRLFRPFRDPDPEYLYNTADHHWAPRGMRIMAKEIADRIERYSFGARARFGAPIVRTAPGPYIFRDLTGVIGGYGERMLSVDQNHLAQTAQTTILSDVRMQDGERPPDDPNSPVMVMGHSFVPKFREQLIKELNLLIYTRAFDHQTTESFADFLRDPELLAHCRVLVWICTTQHMTWFHPLPPQVLQAQTD